MIVRATLLVAAVAIVVFAVGWKSDDADCTAAQQRALGAALGASLPDRGDAVVGRLERSCRGGTDLAAAAGSLLHAKDDQAAGRLLDAAVHRSPQDWLGWFGLSQLLLQRGEQAAAARALAIAHHLNPRYGPAQPPALSGAGASGAQSAAG